MDDQVPQPVDDDEHPESAEHGIGAEAPAEGGEVDDFDEAEDEPADVEDEPVDVDDLEETDFATVAAGATVEEARRKAVEQLRKVVPFVSEADLEVEVLEEGSRGGFFGRGRAQAQVEARLRPSAAASPAPSGEAADGAEASVLRAFVQRVIDLMGIEAAVDASDTGDAVRADITGDDLGILIGRHGQTIDALQYLAAIVVNGDRRQRRQVVVDAEGYRARRESTLKALAERSAAKVSRDASPVTLKPMTAAERKVVHLHLKDDPRVETESEGQEPYRAVVISPLRRR